jgi:hypothetical protein
MLALTWKESQGRLQAELNSPHNYALISVALTK